MEEALMPSYIRSNVGRLWITTAIFLTLLLVFQAFAPSAQAQDSEGGPSGGGPLVGQLDASADTYLRHGASDTNEGASTFLRVRSSGRNRALVQFAQNEIEDLIGEGTLVSASLELEIEEAKNNWGPVGRSINVHRLVQSWVEGNGKNSDVPSPERGSGDGATWSCAVDSNIANHKPDCDTEWDGGSYEATASDSAVITSGQEGIVAFDVTADVEAFLNGTENNGWLIRKDKEGQNGYVTFRSREAGTPHLVITYLPPDPVQEDIVLLANQDAYIHGGSSNVNEGANPGMRLQSSGSNRGLVAFDLPDLTGLTKGTLVLTIADKTNNWDGSIGRLIAAHPLSTAWEEGNRRTGAQPGGFNMPTLSGSGTGVTWNCAIDPNIANSSSDSCPLWNGGIIGALVDTFLISNDTPIGSEVDFDVTADLLGAGGANGWLIKKVNEGQNGEVWFYTKEGATQAANSDLAPRLILEFD